MPLRGPALEPEGQAAYRLHVRHDLFSMPVQYNEVMSLFWAYAEKSNLLTATLTGLAELQVFHDKFHWKVDSEGMRRLVKYTVKLTTQLRAEHAASLMGMPNLYEVATKFPSNERGYYRRSYESYFQLGLEQALSKRRFMPVHMKETPVEPWEPEAWHEQEMAIQNRLLSTAKILPREIAELEIQQMVHIGGGQYLKADDPALVKKEGATLTGQPSSSSARPSAVRPLPHGFQSPKRLGGPLWRHNADEVRRCYHLLPGGRQGPC